MSEKGSKKEAALTARKEKRMKWWKSHKPKTVETEKKSEEKGKREGLRQSTLDVKPSTYTESRLIQQEMQNKSGFKSTVQVKVNVKVVPKPKIVSKTNSDVKQKNNHIKNAKDLLKTDKNDKTVTEEKGSNDADSPTKHMPKNYVLFIGNLPFTVTKEQLEEHFRKTGGVKKVRIPKEKGSEKTRGFAYIEFKDRISHNIALRLHHTTLGGRKINVEFTSIGGGKNQDRKDKLKMKNMSRAKMKMPLEK